MQLWKPDSQLLIEDLFEQVSVRGADVFAYAGRDADDGGFCECWVRIRSSAFWALDAALWCAVHSSRGDWMVSMKGWGKYVWDYESSGRNNPLGRYLSYGSMLVYASGDPVGP